MPIISQALTRFFKLEAAAGLLLIASALLAFIISNSPWESWYAGFLNLPGQIRLGPLNIAKPLLLWINDFWMALFFLLVGLEIKRELMEGSLASASRWYCLARARWGHDPAGTDLHGIQLGR